MQTWVPYGSLRGPKRCRYERHRKAYLHMLPFDFRKSINGMSLRVEQGMQLSPFSGALFVFSN